MARSAQTPSRSAGGISGKRLRKTGVEREEGPASRAGIDRVRVVRLKKRVGGSADGRVGVGRRPNALKRKRRLQPLPCVARHERQRLEPSLTRLATQKCSCCWAKSRTRSRSVSAGRGMGVSAWGGGQTSSVSEGPSLCRAWRAVRGKGWSLRLHALRGKSALAVGRLKWIAHKSLRICERCRLS